MFPYSLTGPQFLLFYAVFSAVVLGVYSYYVWGLGTATAPRLSTLTGDPYKIVFLRAGREEVVRVAVVNLVDRGLLEAVGPMLKTQRDSAADFVRRELDRAILEICATPQHASVLEQHPAVTSICIEYEAELAAQGLLLNPDEHRARDVARIIAVAVLGGVAGLRVVQAVSRGQFNLTFLFGMTALACWIAWKVFPSRATPSGRRALASIKTLTERASRRLEQVRAGGATNEALLMMAVFGIYALPSLAFDFVESLYPRPKRESGSCGSDSGGSSCGGGGGGGCGGCGGD